VTKGCTGVSCPSSFGSLQQNLKQTGIVIPTYNAREYWARLRSALDIQGIDPQQILIVDSSSTDGTDNLAEEAGYQVIRIPKSSFRHGRTRQMAVNQMPWAETLVFLTQDAIPYDDCAIVNLIAAFDDPEVGAAYGRQLPREEANAIEAHARLFNYPTVSEVRDLSSRVMLGFRATFFSNSFAAYRRSAFEQAGGFPSDSIVSEDVSVVAQMLMAGWSLAYQANAEVIHSHPMNFREEFSRYFDIAVHHSRTDWILEEFGHVGGEGARFLISEFGYLMRHAPNLIPLATLKNVMKWLGYQMGLREKYLPLWTKQALSAQRTFWKRPQEVRAAMRRLRDRGKLDEARIPSGN
jgi:rhamnosyltransferase